VRGWVHVGVIVYVVKVKEPGLDDPEVLRAVALGLMVEMMARRLMVPGDVDEFGFHPWITPFGGSIQRIVETWDPAELSPTPGAVCWFQITEEGSALGARWTPARHHATEIRPERRSSPRIEPHSSSIGW